MSTITVTDEHTTSSYSCSQETTPDRVVFTCKPVLDGNFVPSPPPFLSLLDSVELVMGLLLCSVVLAAWLSRRPH